MPNLSLNELKQIGKMRCIKNYKNMSKERLLSALDESELSEGKDNFHNTRIKKIKEDFNKLRYVFFKSKTREIRKNLYDIKNPKNISKSKIKEIEQNVIELEKGLFKLNKYYDYDDTEYERMRDVANVFNGIASNESNHEDYYKPIWTKSAFNGN